MEPITWVLVFSVILNFGQWHHSSNQADEIDTLQTEQVRLIEVNTNNVATLNNVIEVADENRDIAVSVNNELTSCVENLRDFGDKVRGYEDTNRINRQVIEQLENRTSNSNLSQCVVPDWLVNEVTGNNL